MFAKLMVFLLIILRLFNLQVYNNQYFSKLSRRNAAGSVYITPPRGSIYDKYKTPIVSYTVKWRLLYLYGSMKQENASDIVKNVTEYINLSESDIARINKRETNARSIVVKSDLSEEEMVKSYVFLKESNGFYTIPFYKRVYHYPHSTSNIIGYVKHKKSLQDYDGQVALEAKFNNILYGTKGQIQFQRDAEGNIVQHLGVINPKQGGDVYLTINANLQKDIYKIISGYGASCIVSNLETGEILALASGPSYDSNRLSDNISNKDWQELLENPSSPLVNKAISGLYPPGSVVKSIIAYAALEKGIIDEKTIHKCEGFLDVGDNRFHCWSKHGNKVDVYKSLAQSCDIFYYQIALELGIDAITDVAERFGFERKYLDDFFKEERKGNIPRKKLYEKWYTGDTINSSIGQGRWLVSPMQIHNMTAVLAGSGFKNDFVLVSKIYTGGKEYVRNQLQKTQVAKLNENYLNIVRRGLYESVNLPKGTARRIGALFPQHKIVGKTGTAQVRRLTLEQRKRGYNPFAMPLTSRDHGLFSCYFPYKNPKYAVTVVVEHGIGAGVTAVPFTAKIIQSLIDHENIKA